MLVSFNWLKEYVNIPSLVTPEEAALKLTMSTVEVEGVKKLGKGLENIVVGEVKKVAKHPQTDKLKVCAVDGGQKKYQVVCGGSNVKEGMKVALARVGAKIRWHGEGGLVELKSASIRGVESEGMICAASEIGLAEKFPLRNEREILDLSFLKVKPGALLAEALSLDDAVFEIENKSMSNRPDLWGHYGLARELAVLYRKELKKYDPPAFKTGKLLKLKVKVEDDKLCPRYMAVALTGVKVTESPAWLKEKLLAGGLRPINNIVDITNYVMLDLGQPMHAFDAEKLSGAAGRKTIIVRRAQAGERLRALDDKEYLLTEEMLVIADEKRPLALAGVIGGAESAVGKTTQTVIFESANFDSLAARRTALKLGTRTESSARFEKSLDPHWCELALKRAVELTIQFCPTAKVASRVADEKRFYLKGGHLETTFEFLRKKIGTEIESREIISILEYLGFGVKTKKESLSVTVPSWRATKDVSLPEDLVEEAARIYGYGNLKTCLPVFPIIPPAVNSLRKLEHQAGEILIRGLSFAEVHNYSFVSARQIENLGDEKAKYLELDNPLSKEKPYLRRSLLLNLLENASRDIKFASAIRLLEIGQVFKAEEAGPRAAKQSDELLPRQDCYLTCLYIDKEDKAPFWQARRAAEELLGGLKINWTAGESKKIKPWQHPSRVLMIKAGGITAGEVYELRPVVAENFGLESRVGILEVNLDKLAEIPREAEHYAAFSPFPEAERDIAFWVKKEIKHGEISSAICQAEKLVKKAELFDMYEGEKIGKDGKSLAYHITFAAPNRTLKSEEVEAAREKIKELLKKKFGAEIRG
ncbi:MAG: phenylalanine--tRNA ligase subunit beta [Candidatus Magasanikbacteria bacterium]|nr:phenylalanine--tRNA ligase subunit beta [Candidatus Magasanikbacteria bacterium]